MRLALPKYFKTVKFYFIQKPARMSELHLTLEDYPTGNPIEDKNFEMLRDYLQPDSIESAEAMSHKVLAFIPNEESTEMQDFCSTSMMLAEQIPYNHQSQLKLIDLLERLGRSTKFIHISKSTVIASCH